MSINNKNEKQSKAVTQLYYAKKGQITPQMKRVAQKENLSEQVILEQIAAGELVIPANINHKNLDPIGIGDCVTCKINTNIGGSPVRSTCEEELKKLQLALNLGSDAVMDLTVGPYIKEIRNTLLSNCPAPLGTVPIYEAIERVEKVEDLTADLFFEVIEEQAQDGVDFMTIHAGLLLEHVPMAVKRLTGIVSRGGSLTAKWMVHHKKQNPMFEEFDRLLDICRKYDITLSLGDGLRPGSLADASDEAQFAELKTLGLLVKKCTDADVQVMVEGPGHVPFDQIAMNMEMEKKWCHKAPFYILGPIVTDIAPGYDHITSAIGATMGAYSGASMLCYVTPREHLGLPNAEDVRQGVIAYKIAAHAADIARGRPGARNRDDALSKARANFDWDEVFKLSLDPQRARVMHEESHPKASDLKKDYCSMCGQKHCAMKVSQSIKDSL
jgi:phosphomethylpyrimidine synthase